MLSHFILSLRALSLTFFAFVALLPASALSAPVVGGFDSPRSGSYGYLASPRTVVAKALLLVMYPGVELPGTQELTPEFLSGLDAALLVTSEPAGSIDTPLSASEQTALFDYIKAGGNALIVGEGGFDNVAVDQSFFTPFGITAVGREGGTEKATVIQPNTHPIVNGPYGTFTTLTGDNVGWFSNLGPYAQPLANLDFNGQPILAVIERGALGPGSGAVVLTADSDLLFNLPLSQNIARYLLEVPEPSTWLLMLPGAAGLFALGKRRR